MNPRRSALLVLVLVATAVAGLIGVMSGETPVGAVRGQIVAADTGAPIPHIRIALARPDDSLYRWGRTDAQGRFAFARVPVGTWVLVTNAKAHEMPTTRLAVSEGRTLDGVFELKPVAPYIRIFNGQPLFTTDEQPKLRVNGFAPAQSMVVRAYRLSNTIAQTAWTGSLQRVIRTPDGDFASVPLDGRPGFTRASQQTVPVAGRDVEGTFRQDVTLPKLAAGLYVVRMEAASTRALAMVAVTDLGIVAKSSSAGVFVYASNIKTGEPVPGADVELRGQRGVQDRAVTDDRGFATLAAARSGEATVVARAGDSMAIASVPYGFEHTPSLVAYTTTDRPVYRPGHTVHFRSLMRTLTGQQYRVPRGIAARVTITDPRQNVLLNREYRANAYGSIWGDTTLNRAALPGLYTITVEAGGERDESSFSVAEYRKPEYEVSVSTERPRYTQRETVRATVSARYYYGAPVPDAAVTYFVTRSPRYYYGDFGGYDSDLTPEAGDDADYGEVILSGEGRLDADGRLTVEIPPQPPATGAQAEPADYRYTVHATVTDASRRSVEGSGGTLVTQGDFRIEVKTSAYLTRPGQPVQATVSAVDYDGRPVPGIRGTLRFTRHVWVNGEQQNRESDEQRFAATDAEPAEVTVTPRSEGDYALEVDVTDAHGAHIRAITGIWSMASDEADLAYSYGDLEVSAGKRLYREGETAELLVQTSHTNQTALLTIEGPGLIDTRLIRLRAKSSVVRVPVTAEMMPSVRASICFYRGKQIISGDATINVSRERKALKVEVKPDKPTYQPGERATWHIRTLTPNGKPVSAEVALGVVDEALYAIQPETKADIARFFYPRRLYGVVTAYSFPETYLSGDEKAGSTIRTRRSFRDTAFWAPSLITDTNGNASVSFAMPDNLTTWRATCRAATLDTTVGQTTAQATVSKPFLVRLETPRFVTQGDEVELAGVVHNLTGARANATAGLSADGFGKPGPTQQRRVENGATERFVWRVRAVTAGQARIRVWARSGAFSDAMELTIPVLPKGREQTDSRTGDTRSHAAFALDVRSDAVPGTPELTVRLSPSLVGTLFGSLRYLASYPYGCAEQTMSAFLPDVLLAEALKRQRIDAPELQQRLPDMVQEGLLKIYALQGPNGGWAWFRYDQRDAWMTAYVMYGLRQAREAGFRVNDETLSRGQAALVSAAVAPKVPADTRAFCARVLALLGSRPAAHRAASMADAAPKYKPRDVLSDWGRAQLAMAEEELGNHAAAEAHLAILWRHVSESAYRPTENDQWRSPSEHAAAFLLAACQITPSDPRLPDLVRWIMRQRAGDHWCSTRDTAAVAEAVSRYVDITGELRPNFTAMVAVNGRTVATRRFTQADVGQPETTITVPPGSLTPGPVYIEVKMKGRGRLYYSADMRQTAAMDLSLRTQNNSGLSIERSYRRYRSGEKHDEYDHGTPSDPRIRLNSGDVLEVTLTIRAQRPFDYLMVEDPIPAGCEAADRGPLEPWEWTFWWSDKIVRDQMVAFAVRHVDTGTRVIQYRLQAQIPGVYTALPPRIYDMYNPAVRSEAVAQEVTVR